MNPYESPAACEVDSPLTFEQADKICLGGMLSCMVIGCGWLLLSFTHREAMEWAWDNHNLAFKAVTSISMLWWMPRSLFVAFWLLRKKVSK